MDLDRNDLNGKVKILLIDDDSSFRFAMATELRASGYLVGCAENGQRAITMIEDGDRALTAMDLVITDIVMPRKDGLEFCQDLRNVNSDIPVLVITGFLSPEVKKEMESLGCTDFLEKPFSPQDLILQVEILLSRKASGGKRGTGKNISGRPG